MLTLLQQAGYFRSTISIALTLSVAPQYLCVWSVWRVLSAFLPRRMYERLDDIMYGMYQSLVVFFLEPYAGTELIFYGDEIPWRRKENVLYLSNHQSTGISYGFPVVGVMDRMVDWAVVDLISIRQGTSGYVRYILKDGLRYLPMFGFYFPQHGCIYVKRNATVDIDNIHRRLMRFKDNGTPLWLVIFPEGTRYNPANSHQQRESQEFAKSRGLPILRHVLTPRTKATEMALETLSDHFDAIYDLTIAYRDKYEDLLPRKRARSLFEFLQKQDQEIHIHVRRLTPNEIPQDCAKRKQWIMDAFALKDRLLSQFYSEDAETQGGFPGPRTRKELPLTKTLPWAMFWAGVLAPFLATKYGRSLYWKGWLVGSVGTLLYMTILYDRLQR